MLQHFKRSSNRFEIKFLVPHTRIPRIVEEIEPYVYRDPNWEDEFGYPVHSVYWDSEGLALFWEKIEGIKYRRKLRFRRYGNGDLLFVEIKQRLDRTLEKRRARLRVTEAEKLFGLAADDLAGTRDTPPASDDTIVREALFLKYSYKLRPRMAVSYRRRAFFGTFEPDLRITFDRRVQYDQSINGITKQSETGKYIVDPRLIIMEIKFADRAPKWLCKLVSRNDLQMTRLSKYCTAVDRAYFDNALT